MSSISCKVQPIKISRQLKEREASFEASNCNYEGNYLRDIRYNFKSRPLDGADGSTNLKLEPLDSVDLMAINQTIEKTKWGRCSKELTCAFLY